MAEAILRVSTLSGSARAAMIERGFSRARVWTWEKSAQRLHKLLAEMG
jgi:hypothetical protein